MTHNPKIDAGSPKYGGFLRQITRLASLSVAALQTITAPAPAEIGTPDEVPAASLLVPYFGVDLSCAEGAANTIIDIENTAGEPALATVLLLLVGCAASRLRRRT